jgi:hypothetical protein
LLLGLSILFTSCAGGGGGGVYRHHHGHGPWWGGRDYYRDRIIVVPDKEPVVEATPLPSGPEQMPMPDMGAPDFGGDFGGDMGGDW